MGAQAVAADEWQLHWLKEPCIQALAAALYVFWLAAPVLRALSNTAGRAWAHLRPPLASAWAAVVAAPCSRARKRNCSDSSGRVKAATKLSLQDELQHIHASAPASAPAPGAASVRNAPRKHARRQAAASRSRKNSAGTIPAACKDQVAATSPVIKTFLLSALEQTKRPGRVAGDAVSMSGEPKVRAGTGQPDLTVQSRPDEVEAARSSGLKSCMGDSPPGGADDDRVVESLLDTLYSAVGAVDSNARSTGPSDSSSSSSATTASANDVQTVSHVASQMCRYILASPARDQPRLHDIRLQSFGPSCSYDDAYVWPNDRRACSRCCISLRASNRPA